MRWILLLILASGPASAADFKVTISNTMMTSLASNLGELNLGTFDPFNPGVNCATFVAPNSCTVLGRNAVAINLEFNYDVEITSGASNIDLNFNLDNGHSGSTGSFASLASLSDLHGLTDGSSGTVEVNFNVPLFGPDSRLNYGLEMSVDIVTNP